MTEFHDSFKSVEPPVTYMFLTVFALVCVFAILCYINQWGTNKMNIYALAIILALFIVLSIVVIFLRVKVDVNDRELTMKVIGTRRITPEMIDNVEIIEPKPLREYGGWGVRFVPKGNKVGYINGAKMAVRIKLKEGKEITVSTKEPQKLYDAIISMIG